MQYIIHRRFRQKAACGEVNLPYGTVCEAHNGKIFCNGNMLCYERSENAHQYFARDDDGQGLLRGNLTQAIQKTLAKRDKKYQARWDKIWDDSICQTYKNPEYSDYWLWNHNFFGANISELSHIWNLIKGI